MRGTDQQRYRRELLVKSGSRAVKLRANLRDALLDDPLDGFCICFRGGLTRLFIYNPLTIMRREYLFAASRDQVYVYRIEWPPIFGANIGKLEKKVSRQELHWTGDQLTLNAEFFTPLPSYRWDAGYIASSTEGVADRKERVDQPEDETSGGETHA